MPFGAFYLARMLMNNNITWGVDGLGRCVLCRRNGNTALFSGLPGTSGAELLYLYSKYRFDGQSSNE